MTVISRLFRQAPPPAKTPEEQRQELPSLPQASLAGLALGDGDEALRVAATALLDPGDALRSLAGLGGNVAPPAAVRRAAQQRLAQLLDGGATTLEALQEPGSDTAALLAVAAHSTDPSLPARLVATIDDAGQLGELALRGPAPAIRQLAAERVQDPEHVAQLLREARGGDKNVYRILKSKRDALHAQQRAAAEALAAMTTLCASIERHIHQPFSGAYVTALEHLAGQWAAVEAQAPAQLQARASAALERCSEVVARQHQELERQAAAAAALEQAQSTRSAVLAGLPALLADSCDAEPADSEARLSAVRVRWQQLAEVARPSPAEAQQFARYSDAVADLSAFIAQHGSLQQLVAAPDEHAIRLLRRALTHLGLLADALPESARAAAAAVHDWDQARAAEAEAAATALRQVSGLLRKAQGALAAGHSRQAGGIRRALEEKLPGLPVALPPHLAGQLHAFDEQLNALQDWRSFAVAPKRVELIGQMEALIGVGGSPVALAGRIKRLQDEWKLISKGSSEDTQAEWQRFHEAAQKAYEPCREHFAAQAKLRADNLEKRDALLARLQSFVAAHDWQQPDWREVGRALRESRQQWRTLQPVERAANQPLQAAFDALVTDLQDRLQAEYTRNAEAKRALIARAQQLASAEDGRAAAEEAKRLQQAWKDIGLVQPDESQRLWEEFRRQCDALFERRTQQHSTFVSELAAHAVQAAEVCAQAEQLAALTGKEAVEAARAIPSLREAFAAIGELPKPEAPALRRRLEQALERCERQLSAQRALDRAASWDHVFAAADHMRLVRLAAATGAAAEERDARLRDAQAFIDAVPQWPKGTQRMVVSELAREGGADLTANETALRVLCIRAEMFTGMPTPETDHGLKREWQLQQLTKGFGQGRGATPDSQETLLTEWLGAGPVGDDAYAGLRERFRRCWDRTLAGS